MGSHAADAGNDDQPGVAAETVIRWPVEGSDMMQMPMVRPDAPSLTDLWRRELVGSLVTLLRQQSGYVPEFSECVFCDTVSRTSEMVEMNHHGVPGTGFYQCPDSILCAVRRGSQRRDRLVQVDGVLYEVPA
jgi:hypothetical protein